MWTTDPENRGQTRPRRTAGHETREIQHAERDTARGGPGDGLLEITQETYMSDHEPEWDRPTARTHTNQQISRSADHRGLVKIVMDRQSGIKCLCETLVVPAEYKTRLPEGGISQMSDYDGQQCMCVTSGLAFFEVFSFFRATLQYVV